VPEGRLFVLGDHRSASSDSRDHLGSPGGGMIPVDDVIGRADWIVWPVGHLTRLDRPDVYARVPEAADAPTRAPGAADAHVRVPAPPTAHARVPGGSVAAGGAHG
jgi:signal peptidase I